MTFLLTALKYWRESLLVIAVPVLLTAWHKHTVDLVERGRMLERSRVQDSTILALSAQRAHLDTVYRTDTLRWRQTVTQTVTLRDTLLQHLTDTLMVTRFIAASDSTVHACTEVIRTCEQQQALLTAERDAWKAKAVAIPAIERHHGLWTDLAIAGAGIGLGILVHHR